MVIVLVGFFVFKDDIRSLMTRIAKIRLPGGSEISASQLERSREDKSVSTKPEISQIDTNEIDVLLQHLESTEQQREAIRKLYIDERANAHIWEYRYLNYFLALHTQLVLEQLA